MRYGKLPVLSLSTCPLTFVTAQADTQPNPTELAEMAQKANEVVRLLEDLRRMYSPDGQDNAKTDNLNAGTPDDHRPPKRPWEEMSKDGLDGTQETHEVRTKRHFWSLVELTMFSKTPLDQTASLRPLLSKTWR